MEQPTWVALATERLGMPCDQWLIARAAEGHAYRTIAGQLALPVKQGGANIAISREAVRQRLVSLRPLIEVARAQVVAATEKPRAETAARTSRVAARAARDVIAASP